MASIYGINLTLPGAKAPGVFYAVMIVALTLSLSVAVIFWKQKWFLRAKCAER